MLLTVGHVPPRVKGRIRHERGDRVTIGRMSVQEAGRQAVVHVLALPESSPAVVYGLYEVLHAVGTAWTQATGQPPAADPFDVHIVARARQVPSSLGVPMTAHLVIGDAAVPDVAIVCDVNLPAGADPRGRWTDEAAWLRRCQEDGSLVCSVCTGSLCLADAGCLDGMEATTHWVACELFARYYPRVRLQPSRVLLPAGAAHRVVTSGGASSWEDLALYLVARYGGQAEARRIARIFLLGDRSEGQLPFAFAMARRHDDAAIAEAEAWARAHLTDGNPVGGMASAAGLSARTFARRFRAATGTTALDYVHTLRVEAARQRLETTDEATDDVAAAVGYDDPAFFRRLFKRRTGVSPARYRMRFRRVGPR